MDYKNLNDYELIYKVRENNEDAKFLLFNKYRPLIYKSANRYIQNCEPFEYEDLFQEGIIALYRAIDTYDEMNSALFYTYAFICIERRMNSFCRTGLSKKKSLYFNSLEFDDQFFSVFEEDPICYLMEQERFISFKNLFSFSISIVFELKYNGFSSLEISKLLDISKSCVNHRLCKIREILRENYSRFF